MLPGAIGVLAGFAIAVFQGEAWASDIVANLDSDEAEKILAEYRGDATT